MGGLNSSESRYLRTVRDTRSMVEWQGSMLYHNG